MAKVTVVVGNLLKSKAHALVNTVNCVGVMGKGIALEFKKRFPVMYEDYVERCARHEVRLGKPYLYRSDEGPWVINFPTKGHWRAVAKLSDIEAGLEYLIQHIKEWGVKSIAVPPLGCGLGQLEWRVVGPTLYRYLSKLDIPVELYAPHGTPHEELTPGFLQGELFEDSEEMPESQWIKPGWVGLIEIVRRLEREPYHPYVGRVFFQKIAYVATAQGLPTGLSFEKGSYGPFSPALKPMISRLLNNGLIREEQAGRMFHVTSGRTFDDAKRAFGKELAQWDALIEQTVDLFLRMDTSQAEIVATVIYAAQNVRQSLEKRPSERQVFEYVAQWKHRRRPPLNDADVALAIRELAVLGWLDVTSSDNLPIEAEYEEAA